MLQRATTHDGALPADGQPEPLLSPKDLAEAIGLSESTLKRWVDAGVVRAAKTPGGHRRILRSEALRLVRESALPVLRPEKLGMPALAEVRRPPATPGLEGLRLFELLRDGEERAAHALVLSLYLAGRNVVEICDGPVREAMHRIGELWQHGDAGIYVEHRASEIMVGALAGLRSMLPAPGANAPLAIGAAPAGDPYVIPSLSAAMVLESAGVRAQNLGANLPLHVLRQAAADLRPSLVWLSLSCPSHDDALPAQITSLADDLAVRGVPLVVGGRMRTIAPGHPTIRQAISFAELVALAPTPTT